MRLGGVALSVGSRGVASRFGLSQVADVSWTPHSYSAGAQELFIQGRLLDLDSGGLDHRPPFLDLRLVMRAERLRRRLLASRNDMTLLGQPMPHRRIGEGVDHRGVEL